MTMKPITRIAAMTVCRITSAAVAVVAVMLVTTAAAPSFAADVPLVNPVIVTNPAGWKYKDGKKSDKFSGKYVTPSLVPYLTNGNGIGIGIARFDGSNYYSFGPCYQLTTKNNKSWSLKIKKTITMRYNAKNGAFTCTIWTQLPLSWVVYVDTNAVPPPPDEYCIIDVSGGPTASSYPVSIVTNAPVLSDEYKTTKILLRKIPAGSFVMGSPTNELGRFSGETQHTVTLSSNFYMGVFEITQGQYSNVMGSNPAYFPQGAHGPKRPVEQVSWDMVRGGTWPGGTPGGTTFMGTLRTKTGLAFDLPTEAQWEYACRAGTATALNNGTDLTSTGQDPNMDIVGRYWYNGGYAYSTNPVSGAHTAVGSYQANNWGLYDMHGNVWEWCLDWYGAYAGNATDPTGAASGSNRVIRGGSWNYDAYYCRSAIRTRYTPAYTLDYLGFRPALPAGQ